MKKALQPSAIIPPDLYVERDADRQLEATVLAMARPPYLLEARQMGKTNLLLHLKKKREAAGDIVPYFDLSIRIDEVATFFRSLIDLIVDSQLELVSGLQNKIAEIRNMRISEPHREYELSIREILRAAGDRRVIIIFDEIDSVVSTPYSDRLFAQIRSMYFSRINYPEYNNLTYILAGVAEPAELIKDKSISPFNIGEKIYLKDFSYDEAVSLMRKSPVGFDREVEAELYRFAQGNPRMTWDITSELEDIGLSGRKVLTEDVRAAVEKLYLRQFDRAPIDHIRVLAESDADVRSAVTAVRWGHGQELDPKIKSLLYLAGITTYDSSGSPALKNPIIDAALSDEWLSSITERERGPLRVASEQFRLGAYTETTRILSSFRSADNGPLPYDSQFQLALALLYLDRNRDAAAEFADLLNRPIDEERKAAAQYHYATALARLEDFDAAIPIYREVAASATRSSFVAKTGLVAALATLAGSDHDDEALSLGRAVVSDLSLRKEEGGAIAAMLYSLAAIEVRRGNESVAISHLQEALSLASVQQHPAILARMFRIAPEAKNAHLLEAAAKMLLGSRERVHTRVSDLDPTKQRVGEIISLLGGLGLDDLCEPLLKAYFLKPSESAVNLIRLSLDVMIEVAEEFHGGLASYVWRRLHASDVGSITNRLEALRVVSQVGPQQFRSRALRDYIALALREAGSDHHLPDDELLFLLTHSQALLTRKKVGKAFEIIDAIREGLGTLTPDRALVGFVAAYQDLNASHQIGNRIRARRAAQYITSILSQNEEMIDQGAAQFAHLIRAGKELAQEVLREPLILSRPIPSPPKELASFRFGRNSRVTVKDVRSGEVFSAKFKVIKDRLEAGELTIVNDRQQ